MFARLDWRHRGYGKYCNCGADLMPVTAAKAHGAEAGQVEGLIYINPAQARGSSLAPMDKGTDWISLAAVAAIVLAALAIVVIFAS